MVTSGFLQKSLCHWCPFSYFVIKETHSVWFMIFVSAVCMWKIIYISSHWIEYPIIAVIRLATMLHTFLVTCLSITEEERLKLSLVFWVGGGPSILCLFPRCWVVVTLSIVTAAGIVRVKNILSQDELTPYPYERSLEYSGKYYLFWSLLWYCSYSRWFFISL